ncbi:MAG: exodeoxyribonuclease VII large subunit [Geminicoccaceae bacterium]|nr:exodeoxyribonuclease VII large subunit [Geminicoccaceae bacterium]
MTVLPYPEIAAEELPEFSVSELAFALKRVVETSFGLLRVRGELSGFKRANSGHLYFALKDERAVLECVAWRSTLPRLTFEPEDGLEVVCTGRLTTYPGRSRYQLVVERMEPAGIGALMALLEERKRRLAAEGLFDPARKRKPPFLPEVIGVVTSPAGAVIRDILHRIAERCPTRVILWPVLVQGEGAAEQIAAAIRGFSALPEGGPIPRPDVLIVARGGGSIEDLWAFNEEIVVRAAAASTIPLISAVGHETDWTLIDFAADVRAPTPTAAAEIAVPVRRDLEARLATQGARLASAMARELRTLRERLEGLRRGLPEPRQILGAAAQRLDDLGSRLEACSPRAIVHRLEDRLLLRAKRLEELVRDVLRRARERLALAARGLDPERLRGRIRDRSEVLDRLGRHLESLSHERVLERGYVIVRTRPEGRVLPRLAALGGASALELQFADGRLPVLRADGAAPAVRRPERVRDPSPEQGTLL